jgi:hypothetical protein
MRQAPGAPHVVVSVNFSAEPQMVNLASGGAGMRARQVKPLLMSPGATAPETVDQIKLEPFGVFIGEMQ